MSVAPKKINRQRLNIEQKVDIIQGKQKNPNITLEELSRLHNTPVSTIHDILKNKEKILHDSEHDLGKCKNIKNNFLSKEFDEKLLEWFNDRRRRFATIQDSNVQEMAKKLAKVYKVDNFKASNGWLHKFKLRHNISSRVIKGESGLVDNELIESFKEVYSKKLESYSPDNIYNCDETGFFFKCSPNRTLSYKNEDKISGKFSKERLTLLFCVNMVGDKLDPLLIGKAKSPRGFKHLDLTKLKIKYANNSKAWMNLNLFKSWLDNLNERMKLENRKILLTLDNAPVHPVGVEYSNVELFYFPPGLTSMIQPLDQGIINSFKSIYKKKLNSKFDHQMVSNPTITFLEIQKEFKLVDSLKLILESWHDVSKETIINCYRKAIQNAMLDYTEISKEEYTDTEGDFVPCFDENEDTKMFIEKIETELAKSQAADYIEDSSNVDSNEDNYEADTVLPSNTLTHFEANECLEKFEDYFLHNYPEDLTLIYNIKKVFEDGKKRRQLTMLDYIKRKDN